MITRLSATLLATFLVVSLVLVFPHNQVAAVADGNVITAAGAGEFPAGASFNTIQLAGGTFGLGAQTTTTSTANGDFEYQLNGSSLVGLSQWITITGWITSGTVDANGGMTFNGTGTLDMGDGTAPTGGLALVVTLTTSSLTVTIGSTAVPALPKSDGWIFIE